MALLPTGNVVVVNVATPPLRVPVPITVLPFMKFTVPVGVYLGAVTVAVKVTDCPDVDGLTEEVTVVVVGSATAMPVEGDNLSCSGHIVRVVSDSDVGRLVQKRKWLRM